MRIRRSLLFMPGDDRYKIEKGAALGGDSVIMDLEDGVALNRKDAARETVRTALREVSFRGTERLVRVNPVGSPFQHADLVATIDGFPDGYVIPKVQTADDLRGLDRWLTAAEQARGWMEGGVRLLAIIETALGVVNLREIATSTPRLEALIFGAEDLAGDMGAVRTPDGWESFYARSAVVLHAKAFGLDALDSPFIHLDDANGLVAETERALYLGYTGKLAVHPRQIEPIQQVFTPSAEEISHALALISAHESHQAAGRGVFQHEGKMIDMPMIQAARGVVARAQACRGREAAQGKTDA